MPRFFVKSNQIKQDNIEILGEDIKHIKNVLRKNIGDKIEICDSESGKSYNCEITQLYDNSILTHIIEKYPEISSSIQVDIFQGLPKSDKMELIIQKSVELGVNKIIPVSMKRCVVKLDNKESVKKIARWQKISESAAKQCGRNNIPEISNVISLKDIDVSQYDILIVCYENEKVNTLKAELAKINTDSKIKIGVVIGPEGGLDEQEVELLKNNGAKIVTLGNRILRTETVALNILSILMYQFS